MPTRLICDVEPFRYQATPQIGDTNASANQINEQALEDYLNRLREAICADIESIIDECCNGGGGGGGAESFLALNDTPGSYAGAGGDFVAVNAGATGLEFVAAPGGSGSGLHKSYTTSEQATDRTFLGSTVYQKTIDCGALPNATVKDVAHGITNLDYVVAHDSWSQDTSGGNRIPIPFVSSAALSSQVTMFVTGTNVRLQTGINRTNFNVTYVTLFYTKTT